MRLRLLAFFPFAVLMTLALLSSASFLVSTLETSFSSSGRISIRLHRHESGCDSLHLAISEMSRKATACGTDIQCLVSPILCPISMAESEVVEYESLRDEFDAKCGISKGQGKRKGQEREVEADRDWQTRFTHATAACRPVNGSRESKTPIGLTSFLF